MVRSSSRRFTGRRFASGRGNTRRTTGTWRSTPERQMLWAARGARPVRLGSSHTALPATLATWVGLAHGVRERYRMPGVCQRPTGDRRGGTTGGSARRGPPDAGLRADGGAAQRVPPRTSTGPTRHRSRRSFRSRRVRPWARGRSGAIEAPDGVWQRFLHFTATASRSQVVDQFRRACCHVQVVVAEAIDVVRDVGTECRDGRVIELVAALLQPTEHPAEVVNVI